MFERLIAQLLFGAATESAFDREMKSFSGRPGKCPRCDSDAVVGRLGPLTFLIFFAGLSLMILGTLPAGFGVEGLVSGDDRGKSIEWLGIIGVGVGVIAFGAVLIRGARRLAHRSPLFPVRCKACGRRWRQPMPPGSVSLHRTATVGRILFYVVLFGMAFYAIATQWEEFKAQVDEMFS